MGIRYVSPVTQGFPLPGQIRTNIVLVPLTVYLISVPLISAMPLGAAVSRALGVVAAVAFVTYILRGGSLRVPLELVLFGVFIMYSFVGGFVAVDLRTFVSRQFTLVQLWLLLVMIYNVFAVDWAGSTRMLQILQAGAIGAGLIALPSWEPGPGRLGGTLINPNDFGITMLLGLAVTLLLPIGHRFVHKALTASIISAFVLGVALSGSRKAILGVAGLFIAHGMVLLMRSAGRPAKFLGVTVVVVLSLVAVFYWFQTTPYWSRVENLFFFLQGEDVREGSLNERAALMAAGVELWKENPIIGLGTDQFRFHASKFGIRETYSHSNPVEVLANFGLIGALLYYATYVALGWRLATCLRRCWLWKELRYRLLFLTALWMVWLALEAAWVTYYSKTHWIVFAMVLTIASHFDHVAWLCSRSRASMTQGYCNGDSPAV